MMMNSSVFNSHVLRADERLSNVEWPYLQEIDVPSIEINDCLLLCAGFEDRSIEALRRVCETGRTNISLGLVSYLPEQSHNRIENLCTISHNAKLRVTKFIYDREKPAGMGEKLKRFTETFDRVFVDISGMSRLLIVQTLVALISGQSRPLHIIYGEAETYPPSKAQFEQDHKDGTTTSVPSYLSSGIFEIAAAPELGSVSMLGEAIRLVAFPSFDPAQLTNLIHELQPTYAELIHGVPPTKDNEWRMEAIRKLNRPTMNELQGRKDHDASTIDYRDTLHRLLKIYAERSMFDRLVISPTGSKMQAVAVGLFRAALHDVQIVYPTPQFFTAPGEYTVGMRQLYQINLPIEAFVKANESPSNDSNESTFGNQ